MPIFSFKRAGGGRGRGRPRKIPSTAIGISHPQENPIFVKRGRGRPRKYSPKPNPPAMDFREDQPKLRQTSLPDLVGLTRAPGAASAWGSVQKAKRVNAKRGGAECRGESSGENSEGLCFPSAEEFDSSSSTESNSVVDKPEDSWLCDIVIPSPIPDLDELFWDSSIFGHEDFFSDLPDDWEF